MHKINIPMLLIAGHFAVFLRINAICTYRTTMTVKGNAMSRKRLRAKKRVRDRSDGYWVSTEHSPSITVEATGKERRKMSPSNHVESRRYGRRLRTALSL